jgi:hypothetical protein
VKQVHHTCTPRFSLTALVGTELWQLASIQQAFFFLNSSSLRMVLNNISFQVSTLLEDLACTGVDSPGWRLSICPTLSYLFGSVLLYGPGCPSILKTKGSVMSSNVNLEPCSPEPDRLSESCSLGYIHGVLICYSISPKIYSQQDTYQFLNKF